MLLECITQPLHRRFSCSLNERAPQGAVFPTNTKASSPKTCVTLEQPRSRAEPRQCANLSHAHVRLKLQLNVRGSMRRNSRESHLCLICTCERGCLLLPSKKYDVYLTFTRMLVVRAQKFFLASSFIFHGVFFVSYMHTYIDGIINVLTNAVFIISEVHSTMTMFVRSQSFISPPSFMFVGAEVSEVCEWPEQEEF